MKQALIVEENLVVCKALEHRLVSLGFDAFYHAWSEDEAVAAARRQPFDLLIVADMLECGSGMEAARRICAEQALPVLLVSADAPRPNDLVSDGSSLGDPVLLRGTDAAIGMAEAPPARSRPQLC